jgi:hypothetical protein
MPFIEYLRLAFSCGGFPGLRQRDHGPAVWTTRRELAADLIPI